MDILSLAIAKKSGGGGSADAVKYTSQELTEEQQMQARKNLGLYYKESGATVIEWDGDTENRVNFSVVTPSNQSAAYYKVSDRVFSKNDLVGSQVVLFDEGELITDDIDSIGEIDGMVLASDYALSANAGSYMGGAIVVPEDGTYFAFISDDYRTQQLNLPAQETVHKIEEKYLPDFASESYVNQQISAAIADVDTLLGSGVIE